MINRSELTPSPSPPSSHSPLPQTSWTLVDEMRGSDRKGRERASSELCRIYRDPVFAMMRAQGFNRQDAEDLTQELFARFLSKDSFCNADPRKGQLRSYLYAAARRLAIEHWRKENSARRGGGAARVPLDENLCSARAASLCPAESFDRLWAWAVLGETLTRLRRHYESHHQTSLLGALEPYIAGNAGLPPYTEVATKLGTTESAVKAAVSRMRKRFKVYLRQEVADTIPAGADVTSEIEALKAALRVAAR